MKLYCMRHGETNYNRLGLCNADPAADVHLTATGIRQAEQAAEQLRGTPLARIFTSELPRARETAAIVNRYHHLPIRTLAALNDIRSGFEGRPVAEYFAATGADRLHRRVNDGESLLDHRRRVAGFVDWLAGQPRQITLVVAHEETLRALRVCFCGQPDTALLEGNFGNGEIIEFDL